MEYNFNYISLSKTLSLTYYTFSEPQGHVFSSFFLLVPSLTTSDVLEFLSSFLILIPPAQDTGLIHRWSLSLLWRPFTPHACIQNTVYFQIQLQGLNLLTMPSLQLDSLNAMHVQFLISVWYLSFYIRWISKLRSLMLWGAPCSLVDKTYPGRDMIVFLNINSCLPNFMASHPVRH